MALGAADIAYIEDLFEDIPALSTRKMFGGLGIYSDGQIFALMRSDGALLLKGAGGMPDIYQKAGWTPWEYKRDSGTTSRMPYWCVPDDVRDDHDTLTDWARKAIAAL